MLKEYKKIEDFCNLIEYIISNPSFYMQTIKYNFIYQDFTVETSCIWILDSIKENANSILSLIKKQDISNTFDLSRKLQKTILNFMYLWYIDTTLNITNAGDNIHYQVLITWMKGGVDIEGKTSLKLRKYINPKKY